MGARTAESALVPSIKTFLHQVLLSWYTLKLPGMPDEVPQSRRHEKYG